MTRGCRRVEVWVVCFVLLCFCFVSIAPTACSSCCLRLLSWQTCTVTEAEKKKTLAIASVVNIDVCVGWRPFDSHVEQLVKQSVWSWRSLRSMCVRIKCPNLLSSTKRRRKTKTKKEIGRVSAVVVVDWRTVNRSHHKRWGGRSFCVVDLMGYWRVTDSSKRFPRNRIPFIRNTQIICLLVWLWGESAVALQLIHMRVSPQGLSGFEGVIEDC